MVNKGEQVRVRRDLELGACGSDSIVYDMLEFVGKVVTIDDFDCVRGKYKILEDGRTFWWTSEMFEQSIEEHSIKYTYGDLCEAPVRNKDNI